MKVEITPEEAKTIKRALQYTGEKYLDIVSQCVKIDSEERNHELISRAERYFSLMDKF